jgi:hypothetical protein
MGAEKPQLQSFQEYALNDRRSTAVVFVESTFPSKGIQKLIDNAKNNHPTSDYHVFILPRSDQESNSSLDETKRLKIFRRALNEHGRNIYLADRDVDTTLAEVKKDYSNVKVLYERGNDVEKAVVENRYADFVSLYPSSPNKTYLQKTYNQIRESIGLDRVDHFRTHIQLPSLSEKRELYVAGKIFQPGEIVYDTLNERVVEIAECKSNFVVDTKGEKHFLEHLEQEKHLAESEEKTYSPPSGAKSAAKKALKWKEDHGDEVKAMTRTGWTRANQLASGENLSYDTVKRMAAFARHKKNAKVAPEHKNEPWKDNGYVAWLGWGGDAGINWAQRIVDGKEKEKD